ncbi:MAG TPA: gamma-glutamyltransferase, partial [Tetragenococcus sp.]|nr:gamma-glutamyltransferase [Tetragenococcus sp.]
VLAKGGNAVDAAVAVSYALAMTEPYASGLGGGGGMIIYDPKEDQYYGLDYRDSAPVSHDTMDAPTGVPTFVLGMEEASQRYGTMSMGELIDPTIQLGKKGFEVSSVFAKYISIYKYFLKNDSDYLNEDGELLTKNEIMKPKEMLKTLASIRDEGSKGYYTGDVAEEIVAKSWLTHEDLASARVENAEPVKTTIAGNHYASLPAPFSGVTLLQMLKMAEKEELPNPEKSADEYLDNYSRIKQLTYQDRVSNMGDPSVYNIDSQSMLSDSYIEQLSQTPISSDNANQEEDSNNTTHFSIIDGDGMVVSATNTLGNFYGSEIEAGGFYLNAANRLFSASGSGKNKYEAGKKPRNFTAPTIIKTADEKTIAIGTPGGNMIPEFLFQVLYDHFHFSTNFEETIEKNRIYYTKDNQLVIENNPKRKDFISTSKIERTPFSLYRTDEYFGSVQIVEKDKNGIVSGGYDTRRNGSVSESD